MKRVPVFLLLGCLTTISACGGESGDTTEFEGVLAGDNQSGTVSITVAAIVASVAVPRPAGAPTAPLEPAADVTVTGSLKIKGGSSVTLSGTYNTDTRSLTATGGGYTLSASFAHGRLSGTLTGPAGTILFTAFPKGGPEVQLYCGTFGGDAIGVWNLVRHGNDLAGAFHETDGSGAGVLTGTVSGSNVSVTFTGGLAVGTLSGNTMSGTWSNTSGDNGTWTGSRDAC
jgi:hypothetical protein